MRSIVSAVLSSLIAVSLLSPALRAEPQEEKNMPREKTKDKAKKTEHGKKAAKKGEADLPALSFKMNDIDGKEQDLRQYAGKVVLMVNVASKCGFTPQYTGLESLYKKYKDQGLVVLGFPANEFGRQEPGTNEEIKSFCTSKYNVTFPMFAKVKVKGSGICPLYKYLTSERGHRHGGDIAWNFTKFVVNKQGEVVDRFDSRVKPDDEKLVKAIEKALAQSTAPSEKVGKNKGD